MYNLVGVCTRVANGTANFKHCFPGTCSTFACALDPQLLSMYPSPCSINRIIRSSGVAAAPFLFSLFHRKSFRSIGKQYDVRSGLTIIVKLKTNPWNPIKMSQIDCESSQMTPFLIFVWEKWLITVQNKNEEQKKNTLILPMKRLRGIVAKSDLRALVCRTFESNLLTRNSLTPCKHTTCS